MCRSVALCRESICQWITGRYSVREGDANHVQERLGRGAGDDPRVGGGASAPLRQAQLPLRGWGSARGDGPVLLRAWPDPVCDAAAGRGGRGRGSGGPLPGGRGGTGRGRRGRPRGAHRAAGRPAGAAVTGTAAAGVDERFAASRALFESTLRFLDGAQAAGLEHAELETHLQEAGRELFRQLMQDHLELRAQREQRLPEVTDAGQVARGAIEAGHTRALTTVFGEVTVTRQAYRRRRHANLYPADAALNLPVEKHSHGLRQLAALEAARGSFDDTAEAIERATGVGLGKRQAEARAGRAAVDVDDFYAQRRPQPGAGREVLVLY